MTRTWQERVCAVVLSNTFSALVCLASMLFFAAMLVFITRFAFKHHTPFAWIVFGLFVFIKMCDT